MIKTFSFKLYNNEKYLKEFDTQIGICRYIYNIAKELKENAYNANIKLTGFDICKQLTEAKKELPFLKQVHSQTLQAIIERLELTYQNYFRKLKNGEIAKLKAQYINKKTKKGLPISNKKLFSIGKPKWAKKDKYNTLTFKSLKITKKGFKLPKFGEVKVFNFKYLPEGKIKIANLVKKADGLYINVIIEITDKVRQNQTDNIVALDMGITHFLTSSDGEVIENPKHLFKAQKELRKAQRKLSRKYKKEKTQSKNYLKQVKIVAKIYKKVADTRKDFLHKISTKFANNYETIVIEDLNIQGMVRNTKLSKHILDCSWGLFFDLLSSKTNIIKVNCTYSSQECSKCGHTCKENRTTQSHFECIKCGHIANADFDASLVLLKRYKEGTSSISANVDQ